MASSSRLTAISSTSSGPRRPTSATTSTAARSTTACALPARVLEAIRDAVGPDFIVGIRMVADEDWDKGLSREQGVEIARRLVASGEIDFLNIIRGHIETDAALQR